MRKLPQFFSFLVFFLPLLIVASCGMPQSKTTLKISSSMAVTNNTYTGGLVFYGRSSGGKFFSAPVAYQAASGQNKVDIILDKGDWTFAAVGWNGANVFEGTSKCAVSNVKISGDEQTVELDLESSNCTNGEFGGNFSSNQFFSHGLVTCGTLYDNSYLSPPTVISSSTPNLTDYCNTNPNIPPDFKQWARSAKIMIPAIRPGQAPLPNSPLIYCIDLTNGKLLGQNNSQDKRLPSKGLPLVVELYDQNCASLDKKILNKFELREGQNFPYIGFEHKVLDNLSPSQTNLFLLTSFSRNGTTSLLDSLPAFRCHSSNDNPCIKIPKTSSYDRLFNENDKIFIDYETSIKKCSLITTIKNQSYPTGLTNPNSKCESEDGKIFINLKTPDLSTLSCSSSCTLEVIFTPPSPGSAVTVALAIKKEDTSLTNSLQAYNFIYSFIGHEDFLSSPITNSAEINAMKSILYFQTESDKRHYGELSEIRNLLGPMGVGGILSNYTTSASLENVNKNIVIWDDGNLRPYNIKSESDNSEIPLYLQNNSGFYAETINQDEFTHKITVSQILGGAYIPKLVIKWVYGSKVGMLESSNVEVENSTTRTDRYLSYWNTNTPGYERFESYRLENESVSSNIINSFSSYSRAERAPSNGELKLERYNYESKKDLITGNFEQKVRKEITNLHNNYAGWSESVAYALKGSGDVDITQKEGLHIYNDPSSMQHKSESARSPDNTKLINAWGELTASNTWSLNIMLRGSSGRKLFKINSIASNDPLKIKVTINNGGEASVAWVANNSGTRSIYAMTWIPGDTKWYYKTSSSTQNTDVSLSSGIYYLVTAPSAFSSDAFNPIAFDLIDNNPVGSSSSKTLVFAESTTSIALKRTTYSSSSWGTSSALYGANSGQSVPAMPVFLRVSKYSSSYLISFLYNSSGYNLKSIKFDGTNISGVSTANVSGLITNVPYKMFVIATSDSLLDIYFQYGFGGNILKTTYNASTPSHTSLSTLSTRGIIDTNSHYCFVQSMTSSNALEETHDDYGCGAPQSSYAPAIINSVLIDHDDDQDSQDVDVGFKHDIKSLNPETFKFFFTIP